MIMKTKPVIQAGSWQHGIITVLEGSVQSFDSREIMDAVPARVIEFMEGIGWKHVEPERGMIETNGWDYDWWLNFEKGGKKFTASGSGFYGGFGFHKTD